MGKNFSQKYLPPKIYSFLFYFGNDQKCPIYSILECNVLIIEINYCMILTFDIINETFLYRKYLFWNPSMFVGPTFISMQERDGRLLFSFPESLTS